MAGGKVKLTGSDGVATRWKKGQSGNPKGRPVKIFSALAKSYKARGIEEATEDRVAEAMQWLLALPLSEIMEIMGTPKEENLYPALYRIVAKDMMGKQSLFAIREMLNRAHGLPKSKTELTGEDGGPIKFNTGDLSTAQKKELAEMLKKVVRDGAKP
jgi:hypothetical protein